MFITAPSAYYYLTSASPYDIGATLVVGDDEDVGGNYTLGVTLTGGGTLTLSGLTGLTGSGNGTSTLSYTGTLSALNTALNGADIAGLSDETAAISITLTRDADSKSKTRNISVSAYPALAISTLDPVDNATGVAYNRATYTATFSRGIQAGTGNVVLKLVGGAALETFDIATGVGDAGGIAAVSGDRLIISPNVNLTSLTAHAIQIDATAIDGSDIGTGDSFAGIADDTTWSFTAEDWVAPTISTLDPVDGSTSHPIAANLVATFDENVQFITSAGTIRLYNASGDTLIETFTPSTTSSATGSAGGSASISTTTLTIDPNADLVATNSYYVLIDADCVEDTAGNNFAGITTSTGWDFTAVAVPAAAIRDRADDPILDRAGAYILERV